MAHFVLATILCALVAYLLGSCNSSLIFVRLLKGEDIREQGSHNAGLTNAMRCYGKGMAALTLIGDLSKGVVAVLLAKLFCHLLGAGLPMPDGADPVYAEYIAGIFAILGHMFPLFYGFKGGKGVLTGVSVFLVISPPCFLILMAIFILLLWRSRYVSLSSVIATACCPIVTLLLHLFLYDTTTAHAWLYCGLSLLMAAPIILKHRTNIQRLLAGTENRFSWKSKKEG